VLSEKRMCIRQVLNQATTLDPSQWSPLLTACQQRQHLQKHLHHNSQTLNAPLGTCLDHTKPHDWATTSPDAAAAAAAGHEVITFTCPNQTLWAREQLKSQERLAEVAEQVDWPWRPKELEALQQRFKLLVGPEGQECAGGVAGAGAVLTYEGFMGFWKSLKPFMPAVSWGLEGGLLLRKG
jgi:hypothetical protein